jgi:Tol biopolymer transport system component
MIRTRRAGALAAGASALALVAMGSMSWAAAQAPVQIPLMKGWRVKPAPHLKGLADQFFRPDFDDSAWETADIQAKEDPYTAKFVLYRKWVNVPAAWRGQKIGLLFGGVDDDAEVYVDGRKVGEHKGWNQEFALDVTAAITCGEKNLVAVLALNTGGGGSGIWKPVSLALTEELAKAEAARQAELRREFKAIPCKIVHETYRNGNWELFLMSPDGSEPANLTRTPDVHELYPHVSPDGSKICFVADEGKGRAKARSVYYMNLDGTGRTLVARNARQACWKSDGMAIAYLKGEYAQFSYTDFATKGLVIYDLATGKHREHPNQAIHHLYNLCWSPDGKWFLATVHGGMGFKHAILAIEADGMGVYNLGIPGCRPDISPDGKHVAWGPSDWALRVGDLDFSGPKPRVTNQRNVATSAEPMKIYHIDWSPDGRYVTFSRGPATKRLGHVPEIVGIPAEGWNICVGDATATNRWIAITTDGQCNKEPDWAPAKPLP